MQDFEVSQAPAKTLPVWPSLLGLRPPQPWQLRARSVLSVLRTIYISVAVAIMFTYLIILSYFHSTSCQFLRNTYTLKRELFPTRRMHNEELIPCHAIGCPTTNHGLGNVQNGSDSIKGLFHGCDRCACEQSAPHSNLIQFGCLSLPHWEIHKLHQSISPLDHYIKSTAEMADKRQVLVADMEGPFTNRFRLKVLHVKNTSNISSGIFNVLTCLTHIPCPHLVLSPNLQPPVPGTPLVACAAFASLLP